MPDAIDEQVNALLRRDKPLDSYSETGAAPLVLKEKRHLEPD
jgi:hypothetical protein